MTYMEMPPEWIGWVDENVALGVLPQTLIETLISHNFAPELSARVVATRLESLSNKKSEAPSNNSAQNYQYESTDRFRGNSVKTSDSEIPILMKIERPQVLLFGDVFTKIECENLIELSRAKITRSTVVDDLTGKKEEHAYRTSSGTFFHRDENSLIISLDKRISELTGWPVENGEGLQILHYGVGGEYRPHFDYFPPELPGSAEHIAKGGQRVATLVVYLNSVSSGGETIFPEINLEIGPMQGNAVFFTYCNSLNQVDPLTLHGGNPVSSGEKWIATKWIRQRVYL